MNTDIEKITMFDKIFLSLHSRKRCDVPHLHIIGTLVQSAYFVVQMNLFIHFILFA